jgi:hypothetical protein
MYPGFVALSWSRLQRLTVSNPDAGLQLPGDAWRVDSFSPLSPAAVLRNICSDGGAIYFFLFVFLWTTGAMLERGHVGTLA